MGVLCNFCVSINFSEEQLERLYKNDPKTGSILKLTSQKKEQYWLTIKDHQYSMITPNQIFPFLDKPEVGFLYLPYKYFYEGHMQDQKMTGQGRIILGNHQIIYEGSFINNKPNGKGEMSISMNLGSSIRGRWKNGYPAVINVQYQGKEHEIKFKQNCLDQGTIKFADGRKYVGKFIFNVSQIEYGIEGKGILIYKNGDQLEGNFINGFLQGKGTFKTKKKGYIYQGQFKEGLFEGEGIFFFSMNQFLKINWIKNKPHGTGTFTKNNQTYVVNYNQGVRPQTNF